MLVTAQLSVPVNTSSIVVSQAVVNAFAIGAIREQTGLAPSVKLTVVEHAWVLPAASDKIQLTVLLPLLKVKFWVVLEPVTVCSATVVAPVTL